MCSITAISRLPEKYFHEDVVELAPFPGQGPGLSGLKDVLRGFRAAFPDMHWSVEEQIEEGDKVVSRFVWTRHPSSGIFGRSGDRTPSVRLGDSNRPHRRWENQGYQIIMDALGLMAQMGVFAALGGELKAES